MMTLQLVHGDVAFIKGKRGKSTVLIVIADDNLDDGSARINLVGRNNLRVGLSVHTPQLLLPPVQELIIG